MKPLRTRLLRAAVLAALLVVMTADVASANAGGAGADSVPYDPGLPNIAPILPWFWPLSE